MGNNGKIRLNMELSQADDKMFSETETLDKSPSRSEMLRKAVRLLRAIKEQQAKGGKFILENKNGEKETLWIL